MLKPRKTIVPLVLVLTTVFHISLSASRQYAIVLYLLSLTTIYRDRCNVTIQLLDQTNKPQTSLPSSFVALKSLENEQK